MLTLDGKRLKDNIKWDKNKEVYVFKNNNRTVTQPELYRIVRQEVERYEQKMESLTTRFVNGNISFEQWQTQTKRLVKDSHVNMVRLGRGGSDRTFGIHYLEVGNDLRTVHYPALRKFAEDIKEGKLTDKQIIARSKLYGSASKTSFEKGRVAQEGNEIGVVKLGRRRLGSCSPHCDDCLRYALIGWQKLEDVIIPGTYCKCRGNCCCSIEIKESPVTAVV